jgi:phage terminase small subunit
MSLTAKQEHFCQCLADGMNQADAYRTAYDASKMKDTSIHVNASKLLADTKVAQRVAELKAKLVSKALWTREMSVQALVSAYKIAKGKDNASGMTGAIKELNAMHGFNEPTKHELSGPNGGPMDIAAIQITLVKPNES